ncbi:MAG: pyridoxal phosphate-dependent aminotransferase [Oscillospiraceae bacterium]|nr:pyridoxal phosphate-dependent aminotransferase [Oscillospiraceae bacterium]
MISEKMKRLAQNNSVIRAMFEEGQNMARAFGAENVYDFSLGNPSVPAPAGVKDAIVDILTEEDSLMVHGYMSNVGYEDVRQTVAENLNRRFGTDFGAGNIIMTVGAAGGLNVILKTLLNPGDEVLTFAPYFTEYGNYVMNYDGVLVVVSPNTVDFQPNLREFAEKITPKTKAVIINNPNNPTGVVYSHETCMELGRILREKQKEFGTSIYLISDEPYRELAYDGVEVPFLTKYYANTIVGYSWSKSLSLPGERIGYLLIPNECDDFELVYTAASIATRVSGFVNAPSLLQRAVARCIDSATDVEAYNRNREALYNGLKDCGFECIKPQGAFYLFVKTPTPDEKEFVQRAKKYHILVVPGSSFACPGYVRIAYCVSHDMILRALPHFKELAAEYGL